MTISVGSTASTVFTLADCDSLWVKLAAPVLQGGAALPAFMTYTAATLTLAYNPTLFTYIGTYTISANVSNSFLYSVYTFTVTV